MQFPFGNYSEREALTSNYGKFVLLICTIYVVMLCARNGDGKLFNSQNCTGPLLTAYFDIFAREIVLMSNHLEYSFSVTYIYFNFF